MKRASEGDGGLEVLQGCGMGQDGWKEESYEPLLLRNMWNVVLATEALGVIRGVTSVA